MNNIYNCNNRYGGSGMETTLKRKMMMDNSVENQNLDYINNQKPMNNCRVDDNKKFKLDNHIINEIKPKFYFMPFHLVTCGLQGNDLGRDEAAILQLGFQLIDCETLKVISSQTHLLQVSSLLDPSADISKIHISVPARELANLSMVDANISTLDLTMALNDIHNNYVSPLLNATSHVIPITLGNLPLRAVLHRESRFRGIKLHSYWSSYFDLCYQITESGLFPNNISSNVSESNSNNYDPICQLLDAVQLNRIEVKTANDILKIMSQTILHLLQSGWQMQDQQFIHNSYLPAVFHVDDSIEPDVVVMIKPIDYKTPLSQIIPFFNGVNLAPGGIAILMAEGRRSNKILVRLENKIQRDIALMRDKHHFELGSSRFITMTAGDSKEFMKIAGYENENVKEYLSQMKSESQVLVRMKGLPFSVTKEDVLNFFQSNHVKLELELSGVFLVQRSNGELNGDAFVIFKNEVMANKATSLKGGSIGSRYVEIFQSTSAEMNQVVASVAVASKSNNLLIGKKLNPKGLENDKNVVGLIEVGIVTHLVPLEATDTDYVRYLGNMANLCSRIVRLMIANNPPGFTSYFADLKTTSNAEVMLKHLQNRTLHVKSTQQDCKVINLIYPPHLLSSNMNSNTDHSNIQLNLSAQFNPLLSRLSHNNNNNNSNNNMLSFHPGIFPLISNSNIANNVSILSNNYLSNAISLNGNGLFSPLSNIPNLMPRSIVTPQLNMPNLTTMSTPIVNNMLQLNHLQNSLAKVSPQPIIVPNSAPNYYNLCNNNNNAALSFPLQNSSLLANVVTTIPNNTNSIRPTMSSSRLIYLYGANETFKQNDLDTVFQPLINIISELPKLLQNDNFFYASFNTSNDAMIALQKCPVINYFSQTIQLLPITE